MNIRYGWTTLFLIFMQLNFWLESTEYSAIGVVDGFCSLCLFLGFACLISKWLVDKTMQLKQLVILFIVLIVVFIGIYNSGGQTVAKMILFGLAVKNVPYKKVYKDFMWINAGIVVFVVSSAFMGIIENTVGYVPVKYYSLGFTNPNTAALLIFTILPAFNYLYYKKIKIMMLLAEAVIVYILFRVTYCRSVVIVVSIIIVLTVIDKYFFNLSKLFNIKTIRPFVVFMFAIFSGMSYIAGRYYNVNTLLRALNIVFSWRFWHWSKYISSIKITLFGSDFEWGTLGTLDNGYLVLLYRYGIIIWIVYFVIFIYVTRYALKEKDSAMLITILGYEAYIFVESYPLMVNANVVILYFFWLFWIRAGKKKSMGMGERLNDG